MTIETAANLFRIANADNAKSLDYGRKAAFADAQRDPNANYFCMKAEDFRVRAIHSKNAWAVAAAKLSPSDIIAIVSAA